MRPSWGNPPPPEAPKQPRTYFKAPPEARRNWLEQNAKHGIFPEFHQHPGGRIGYTMERGGQNDS